MNVAVTHIIFIPVISFALTYINDYDQLTHIECVKMTHLRTAHKITDCFEL